jgi:hypothetical protein
MSPLAHCRTLSLPVALGVALLLHACGSPQKALAPAPAVSNGQYWVTVTGTIRGVERDKDGHSHVLLETESGEIFEVVLLNYSVPAWTGLRGTFAYESASKDQGLWKNFIVKRRLPDTEAPK